MLIIAHGGAGNKKPSTKALNKLSEALISGNELLTSVGTAMDAVVRVISILEDSGLFNAGLGSNLQLDGVQRLDASIMNGSDLSAGSVIGIEGIQNPIKAALSATKSPHVMFTNRGSQMIAKGLKPLPTLSRKALEKLNRIKGKHRRITRQYEQHFSTVGAVALDMNGNLASGASTGGIPVMFPGRVGDTPVIGAGIYADNSLGAVSCSGQGEAILRISLAKEVCMQLSAMSPLKSSRSSLNKIIDLGGKAGVISIDAKGRFAIVHNTQYMASGYVKGKKIVVNESFTQYTN